jgi:hypothetical protein
VWYQNNKAEHSRKRLEYYHQNKEKVAASNHKYREEHKEEINAKRKKERLENVDKYRARGREFYVNNKEKIAEYKRGYKDSAGYAATLLGGNRDTVPPELVEVKRLQVKIQRLAKQK